MDFAERDLYRHIPRCETSEQTKVAMTHRDGVRASQDSTNQTVWAEEGQVARFAAAGGWIDRSERALIERVFADHVDADVLDIGVGGGRTVPLLAPRAATYVAIDFVPELVSAAIQRFPGSDIRVGDARELEFPDGSFDVVFFSINGLDAIAHDDRRRALHEIRRVLRPSGTFVFSTHNSDGPGPRERPWTMPPMSVHQPRSSARTLMRRITRFPTCMRNYHRLRPVRDSGPGWMVTSSGAHDFGLVIHYTSATTLEAELRDAGFTGSIELWDDRAGLPARSARPQRRWWYFNVVAHC
jgi:ubiquinone/menaquinone biosynthesis C-methylase UbiE